MRPPPCVVGCILALVLLCQSAISQQIQFGDEFNFVVLSDLHVGESEEADNFVQDAISIVNEIKETKNIAFVVITGDITSNAMPAEYQLARQYLDVLEVPYYPILGNHDIWQYTKPTTNTSWEEKNPTGDALFVQYFGDIFVRDNITHNFESVWNPVHGFNSIFINWELRLKSGDGYFVLLGLDFVTRGGATNPKDLFKGAAPTAELQNFQGGTLFWLRERLSLLPDNTVSIVTAHHHTLVTTPFFIPDYFSMNYEDRDMFKNALLEYWPEEAHWGALVGHMHFWDDQYALFPTYRQWETTAAKSDGSSGLTIASVQNGKIQKIERCCGTTESGELLQILWKAFAGAFLLVMSIYIIHHAYITGSAWVKNALLLLGFVLLVAAQLYPFTGGTGILAKHMAVNLTGPIGLVLNLLFGIKSKVANAGYFSYFLIFAGTAALDFVRYPVRTNWLLNGDNYNVFYTFISGILALGIPALIVRKDRYSRWGYPVLLSIGMGVLLELIGGSISAILYRLILPITLDMYNELIRVVIGLLVVVGIAQIWLLTALAKNWNVLLCIPIILASQTTCNAVTQLLLRSSSFPLPDVTRFPLFLASLLTVVATLSFASANKQEPKVDSTPSISSGQYVAV